MPLPPSSIGFAIANWICWRANSTFLRSDSVWRANASGPPNIFLITCFGKKRTVLIQEVCLLHYKASITRGSCEKQYFDVEDHDAKSTMCRALSLSHKIFLWAPDFIIGSTFSIWCVHWHLRKLRFTSDSADAVPVDACIISICKDLAIKHTITIISPLELLL